MSCIDIIVVASTIFGLSQVLKMKDEDLIKTKNMKTVTKSFREAIDFPDECFSTQRKPTRSKNFSPSSVKINRHASGLIKKKFPSKESNRSSALKKDIFIPDSNFVETDRISLRRSSRLDQKTKLLNCTFKSVKDASIANKVFLSTSKSEKFCTSFDDSFNENFLKSSLKFQEKEQSITSLELERKRVKEKSPKKTEETDSKVKDDPISVMFNTSNYCADSAHHLNKDSFTGTVVPEEIKSDACGDTEISFNDDLLKLSNWGLPESIVDAYHSQNITTMFQWQAECLSLKNVLKGGNLVYSAPTSAGKTLVAEILMLKKVVETKKKGLMILPFVSVVREKVNYLQKLFQNCGIKVDGYMGTYNPPGGFNAIDIAICTIEKANNLINRLIEDGRLKHLGIIVVDELHMLGDSQRGYFLELLLTKLLYTCKKNDLNHVQVLGMSATLPNLDTLALWLNADLYRATFRPVPLQETIKIGTCIYDSKSQQPVRDLKHVDLTFPNDADHTIYLAMETVVSGHSVLVFCPSKNWCEKLAENIAREVFNLGKMQPASGGDPATIHCGSRLREVLDGDQLKDVLIQLMNCPAGLDRVLGSTVPFGVAFHHAGLTFDERDIIESAFRFGIIKFLVATSTLSSGVNLPAKRVIIRSPMFCGSVIDVLTYKQMVGRAGRKGIDTSGESILLCKESEKNAAKTLLESDLHPVKSCLIKFGDKSLHSSIKRAILEIIASGVARSSSEVAQYTSCTLLSAAASVEASNNNISLAKEEIENGVAKCLQFLIENEFIVTDEAHIAEKIFQPTRLGQAVLASGFSPDDSLRILKELQLARRCFVLENDLHILYEVTPPYLSDQFGEINWLHYLSVWEQLSDSMRRVGSLVGIEEQFIGGQIQGQTRAKSGKNAHRLAVHRRFYASLALCDLIQEVPLANVAQKYNCSRGILQSLQQTTSTFAGMLTVFCNRLGWHNLELLFSQFQKRVHFGIQQELCDLVRMSSMNGKMARVFYNGGYETVSAIAAANPSDIAFLLNNMSPFESVKQECNPVDQLTEPKHVWIAGHRGMSAKEAAQIIVNEARKMIEQELGVSNLQWKEGNNDSNTVESFDSSSKLQATGGTSGTKKSLLPLMNSSQTAEEIASEKFASDTSNLSSTLYGTHKSSEDTYIVSDNPRNSFKGTPNSHDNVSCNDSVTCSSSKKLKLDVSNSSASEDRDNHISFLESFQDISSPLSSNCKLNSNVCISDPSNVANDMFQANPEDLMNDEVGLSQAAQMESIYLSDTFCLNAEFSAPEDLVSGAAKSFMSEPMPTMNYILDPQITTKEHMTQNNLRMSSEFLFTKSQANYFCEHLSFDNDSDTSMIKGSKHLKVLEKQPKLNTEENAVMLANGCANMKNPECNDDALLNISEDTEKLFPEAFSSPMEHNIKSHNNNFSLNLCEKNSLSKNAPEQNVGKLKCDLTVDLDFCSQFSMCPTVAAVNASHNKSNKDGHRGSTPFSGLDCNVLCRMSNLKLDINVPQNMDNHEKSLEKNASVSNIVFNSLKDNPISGNMPVEYVSPSPPKVSLCSVSENKLILDSLFTPKKAECPNFSKKRTFFEGNMFEKVQFNETYKQNLFLNEEKSSQMKLSTNQFSMKINEIYDDMFCSFMTKWKSTERFSFCIACEKTEHKKTVIGPKVKESKNKQHVKECMWIFGSDISVVGIGVCCGKDETFFIPLRCCCNLRGENNNATLTCNKKIKMIQDIFENHLASKTVIAYDLKAQYKVLCNACNITFNPCGSTILQDPSVACWLLEPSQGQQSLYNMVKIFLPDFLSLLEDVNRKVGCTGLHSESSISAKNRASTEAFIVFHMMEHLIQHLQSQKLYKAFISVEMPVVLCFAKMEQNGLGFDSKLAVSYRLDLESRQQRLMEKAHQLAGRKFNLMSPKDVAKVLYKELKLNHPGFPDNSPAANKHLGIGFSSRKSRCLPPELKTSKAALEKMKHLHPLPGIILEWRKITFCLSQVLMPMLKERTFCQVVDTDRLHSTCYIYTVTGRVNMHSPNIQFVPRDFDVLHCTSEDEDESELSEYSCAGEFSGICLRNMFISSKGHILLSADYFQLELRLLAHLSGDRKLLSLLNGGNDVFKMIASTWKGINACEVSDNLRQQAKQICYGIIYGIGPTALGERLGVRVEEAAVFMDSFMNTYPEVKIYLKSVIEKCRDKGYVLTLANRRRYLPAIKSTNSGAKGCAERQAINTTIQGSAADLVKSAIIKLEQEMRKAFPETQWPYMHHSDSHSIRSQSVHSGGFLVLQLHDELIFEIYEKDLETVIKIIKMTMENCTKLKVKLPVRIKTGVSWGKMKELIL